MEDLTIIYYSANAEKPEFEQKIIKNLKESANGIPIVSITHKAIDLGINVQVGEQPMCYSNLWKQQLAGLKLAKTRFCVTAEADCLYPPDYFKFIPLREDLVYRYNNVWCYWKRKPAFYKKPSCEGAQMCGRKYWIERLEQMLDGHKGWKPMETLASTLVTKIFPDEDKVSWGGDPVITFKTGDSIGGKTSLVKGSKVQSLQYWGTKELIYNKMFR